MLGSLKDSLRAHAIPHTLGSSYPSFLKTVFVIRLHRDLSTWLNVRAHVLGHKSQGTQMYDLAFDLMTCIQQHPCIQLYSTSEVMV
ncbi:hypothetical protein J6590_080014 [Homalodisca vitripennis]|nr:hypothetical protein J6590_080014 [Homalodisca vitripennis]